MIDKDSVTCRKCGVSVGSLDTGTGDIHIDVQITALPGSGEARVTGMLRPGGTMILVCPNCQTPVTIKPGRHGGREVIEK